MKHNRQSATARECNRCERAVLAGYSTLAFPKKEPTRGKWFGGVFLCRATDILATPDGSVSHNPSNSRSAPLSDQSQDESPEARFFRLIAQSMKWFVIEELRKHKWLQSKAAGHDLGMAALDDWERRFWIKFCRWRRFEHIEGDQCWIEFNGLDFAIVKNVRAFNDLLNQILTLMKDRKFLRDNLEMIEWAKANPHISEDHVIQFLTVIDINSARMTLPEEWKRIAAA
jgi:hypothetical protein